MIVPGGGAESTVTQLTTIEGQLSSGNTNTAGIRTDLGTDGVEAPPAGTGVRGWLRAIYDTLKGTLSTTTNQTQWNGTTVDTSSGNYSAGTVRVVLSTNQPALTNALLVDNSANPPAKRTDALNNSTTALTPKRAVIAATTSGSTQVVAAVVAKKIRVLSFALVCGATVNVKFQSHVTPTDITGLMSFAANGGVSSPLNELGHFETVSGEALDINLSGIATVGGYLTYVEV